MSRYNYPLFPSQAVGDHLGHNVSLAPAGWNDNARITLVLSAVGPSRIDCSFLVIVKCHHASIKTKSPAGVMVERKRKKSPAGLFWVLSFGLPTITKASPIEPRTLLSQSLRMERRRWTEHRLPQGLQPPPRSSLWSARRKPQAFRSQSSFWFRRCKSSRPL